MVAPSPEEVERERADHEAGHYVLAFVLEMLHRPVYVTIADGTAMGSSDRIGGDVAAIFDPEPTPQQWGAYAMAGMAAQMKGINVRNGWEVGDPRAKDAVSRVLSAGAGERGDFASFYEKVGKGVDVTPYLERANSLVEKNWRFIEAVSRELYERKTLFHEEATLIIGVVLEDDPESKACLEAALETYRIFRREVSSGDAWQNFNAHHPGLKFFESFASLKSREGWLFEEDETA